MGSLRNEPILEGLVTEAWDPADADLDRRTTGELVALMNDADASMPEAVARAHDALVATIESVVAAFARGGRLVYVGAGTPGRLALAEVDRALGDAGGDPRVAIVMLRADLDASTARARLDDAGGVLREALDP